MKARVIVTDRDRRLIATLNAYEMLTTKMIAELLFPNIDKRTVLRRLRKLAKEKLIRKIHGLKNGEVVWVLTAIGTRLIGSDTYPDAINRNSLEHDLTLAEIRIHLEREGYATSWITEQQLRRMAGKKNSMNDDNLVPDAIFATKTPQGYEPVALELEISGKSGKRYQRLLYRYRYQVKFYAVWYVVPNKSLGSRIEREWNKVNAKCNRPAFRWFLLADILNLVAESNLHKAA